MSQKEWVYKWIEKLLITNPDYANTFARRWDMRMRRRGREWGL